MTKVYLVTYYDFEVPSSFPVKVFKSKGLAEAWVLKKKDVGYDIQEMEYVDA